MKKNSSKGGMNANNNYISKDEKYDKKAKKKLGKEMSTAGIATAFKKTKSTTKKMNGPKIKLSRKG